MSSRLATYGRWPRCIVRCLHKNRLPLRGVDHQRAVFVWMCANQEWDNRLDYVIIRRYDFSRHKCLHKFYLPLLKSYIWIKRTWRSWEKTFWQFRSWLNSRSTVNECYTSQSRAVDANSFGLEQIVINQINELAHWFINLFRIVSEQIFVRSLIDSDYHEITLELRENRSFVCVCVKTIYL